MALTSSVNGSRMIRMWNPVPSGLHMPGMHKLWALCRDHPGAAVPAARDEAPLRLVSWLSFRLSIQCQRFIQAAMDTICSKHVKDLVVLGQHAFPSARLTDADSLRELLLSEISLAGMASPPAAVRELFETFLRPLTLPRLIHFFDLVLPQLVPRWEASAGQARSRLECHILRLCEDAWSRRHFANSVRFSFAFSSYPMRVFATLRCIGATMRSFCAQTLTTLNWLTPVSSGLHRLSKHIERMCS